LTSGWLTQELAPRAVAAGFEADKRAVAPSVSEILRQWALSEGVPQSIELLNRVFVETATLSLPSGPMESRVIALESGGCHQLGQRVEEELERGHPLFAFGLRIAVLGRTLIPAARASAPPIAPGA
jgi:hypothetical protein